MFDTPFFELQFHLAAANIIEGAQGGSNISASFANDFWSQIFKMGLYGRIVQAGLSIATIGLVYRGYHYLQDVSKNVLDIEKVVGTLITFLLTVLMLTRMDLSMNTVLAMRNIGNNINTQVMQGIGGDLAMLQANRSLATVSASQPYFVKFQEQMKTCAPKAQAQCYQNAVTQLQTSVSTLNPPDSKVNAVVTEIVDNFNKVATAQIASGTAASSTTINPAAPNQSNLWQNLGSTLSGAADAIVKLPANAVEAIISMILTVIAIGFYFALELTLILFGLTFPINIALSLFDYAPLKNWLGNFWLLINAKLCFCIIVGIISYLQLWVQTNSNNALSSILLMLTGLLMAVYAPVITFFYVQGSALALAGAMNAIPGNLAGGVAKGVGKVGGKVGGSFMGGLMKGVGVRKLGKKLGKRLAAKNN
jgi:hypothetical protein